MSGKVVGMVFDHYPNGGSELLLAVKLADNASDDGTRIYPSVATLAGQTRQSERTVQYQVKRMVAMGWLVLVREATGGGRGGGYGRPREYRIHPDWIAMHDVRIPEDQRPKWVPLDAECGSAEKLSTKEMGAKIAPIKKEMGATAVAEMGAIAVAPEPSLTVINQIPPVSPTGDASGFEAFIGHWPQGRRSKLAKAKTEFDRVVGAGVESAQRLIAAAAAMATTDAWRRDGGRYVPLPDKWLREQRWTDGLAIASAAGGGAEQGPWQESVNGVQAMGEALGVGRWDRAAFDSGVGESWPVYRSRGLGAARGQRKAA